jgi:hypothetical protein
MYCKARSLLDRQTLLLSAEILRLLTMIDPAALTRIRVGAKALISESWRNFQRCHLKFTR